jgi:nucleotide-binding universal stress UspA family protein
MTSLDVSADRAPGRVVVGLDGSPSSIWALRHGARIASALGLLLEAVTVWHHPDAYDGYDGSPLGPDVGAMQADAVAEVFGGSPPAGFECRVLQGATIATLLRESTGAEMLVLGSRGRGGFLGLLLGSVSTACAQHATCPVLICHSGLPGTSAAGSDAARGASGRREQASRLDAARAAARPGSFDEPPPVRAPARASRRFHESDQQEIVVGVDGTTASTGALRQGARFAESMGLPLRAICASDTAATPALDARAVLTEASRQVFGSAPPRWFHSSVRTGSPAMVLGQASEYARMLIIGHSGTGAPSATRDSVSSTIALQAVCPVVIFHATHAADPESFHRSAI